jgi:hypothetical protein
MPNVDGTPLNERFEAAAGELAAVYFDKARRAKAGERPYPGWELYEDLYRAAGNHGLIAEALWAYFRLIYLVD